MAKFERKAASDLDLIKWQYIRMDSEYRKFYDEIRFLFEEIEEPVLSDDFTKSRRKDAKLIPTISDVANSKRRTRMRINLTPEENERWEKYRNKLRKYWDLVFPIDYRIEMPLKIQFADSVAVRPLMMDSSPHKLLIEIDISFTNQVIFDSIRPVVTQYKKAFESIETEKAPLEAVLKKALAFERRTFSNPPISFEEIADELDRVHGDPTKIVDVKKVQRWVSEFRKCLDTQAYFKFK